MIPHNTPNVSIQPHQAFFPVGNEGYAQAAEQLDRKLLEIKISMLHSAFRVGLQAGNAIQTLRANKLQLEFANRALEFEIAQLRSVHVAELNAALGSNAATIKMISQKVNAMVIKFDLYKIKYPTSQYSSTDIDLFVALNNTISQYCRENVIEYPEYRDRRTNQRVPQAVPEDIPVSDGIVFRQADPIMRSMIEQPFRDYETLEREIAPVRRLNLNLIDRKEMMIDFHEKYLPERLSQERTSGLENVLEAVRSTFNNIQWTTFATACRVNQIQWEFFKSRPRQNLGTILLNEQDEVNKKVKKIKATMASMISTLEALVNPQH